MIKHTVNNYALINEDGKYRKVDHCTVYADNDIDIIRFVSEKARDSYIADNKIIVQSTDDTIN